MASARPSRVRAAPAHYDEEQAAAYELAQLAWQERNPAAVEVEEESSSDSEVEEGPAEDEERKESDRRPPTFPWSTEHTPVQPHAFAHAAPPRAADTPLDFFRLFMPRSYVQSMAEMTNAFAEAERPVSRGRAAAAAAAAAAGNGWTEATTEEIDALLGCLIYMGIVRLNATHDYWAEQTQQAFVADCFPRNRFLVLLRRLRVSEGVVGEDERLEKLQQLIDLLEGRLRRYFYPGRHICVDEAMVGFQGRSVMVQYIAKKSSPTGFKVWMLVDCATNYVCAFDVFTGRKGRAKESRASAAVVLKLIERLEVGAHHVVAMDGYFSSVQLAEDLLAKGFYTIGTTRHNRRHFPKELLAEVEKKERGEWVWRQKKDSPLVATSWMDKKPVHFLSTCADAKRPASVKRWVAGESKAVACPEVVPLYIRTMRGVDVFAQRQSYNKIGRRSRKWFFSLVWFLVDVAIHNAFILYQQKHHKQHYDEKAYRKELMQLLTDEFSARKKAAVAVQRSRDVLHSLEHHPTAHACRICSGPVGRGGNNRRSHYSCVDCNIALCVPACYNNHIQALAQERIASIDE